MTLPAYMKCCVKCGQTKDESEYYFRSKVSDRLRDDCKSCVKRRSKENPKRSKADFDVWLKAYREKNKERIATRQAKWYRDNIEHCKTLNRNRNIEKKEHYRDNNLKKSYGISLADYNSMLEAQDGRCKICRSTEFKSKRTTCFAVDHCHATGTVRGLLCHSCNRALGLLHDNISTLEAALIYLKEAQ